MVKKDNYNIVTPSNFEELLNILEECSKDAKLVYRGVENKNYILSPVEYREIGKIDINEELLKYEKNQERFDDVCLNLSFNEEEIKELYNLFNYSSKPAFDRFDIYTKLQHLGFKTRLLDFSTSFEIALFFACSYWDPCFVSKKCSKNDNSTKDGLIYVIDTSLFGNQIINLDDVDENDEEILNYFDDQLYGCNSGNKTTGDFLFIRSFTYDDWFRMKKQKSCFVLFPQLVELKYVLPDKYVYKKIIIKAKLKKSILKYLEGNGINWEMLKKVKEDNKSLEAIQLPNKQV